MAEFKLLLLKMVFFNTANLEIEDKVDLTAKEASLFYTVVGLEALNPKSFIDLTTLKV